MSTLKVTHLQNESNSAPSISISSAVGGGVTFAGISTFYNSIRLGTDIEGHTSADDLTIATSGDTGMTIRSGTSNQGSLYFSDATSGGGEYAGWLRYSHQDSNMTIGVAENEKLRITSSGNVNIGGNYAETSHVLNISDSTKPSICLHTGTTQRADFSATTGITSIRSFSNSPFTINIGGSGETEAFRITGDGNFGFGTNAPSQTSSGRTVLSINGTANSLLNFSHGGTLTGFIYGANDEFRFESSDTKPLIFRTAGGTALTIDTNAKLILPTGSPGIQFGSSDTGTNITSQTLDDYEEGTWSPVFSTSSDTASGQVYTGSGGISGVGKYTKIGRTVHCSFDVALSTKGTFASGYITLGGLPFTNMQNNNTGGVMTIGWYDGWNLPAGGSTITAYVNTAQCYIMTPTTADGNNYLDSSNAATEMTNTSRLIGQLTLNLVS